MHSLFKQIDVTLNDVQVTQGTQLYPYKAYIEKLVNYSAATKASSLSTALWYDDDNIAGNTVELNKTGGKQRQEICKEGKYVEMIDRLHLEIFNVNRFLLNNVTLKMRLLRQSDSFTTIQPTPAAAEALGNYHFKIESCRLKIRRVQIATNVLLAQSTLLTRKTAKYPIDLVQMKIFNVTLGSASVNIDNVFLGTIPSRIIIGMLSLKAMEGDGSENPFNFKHFDVKSFGLYVDGVLLPTEGYTFSYNKNKPQYLAAYQDFLECTGKWGTNKDNGITREMWLNGCTLFAFDLTPDMIASSSVYPILRQSSVRIDIKFSAGLKENINILVYGENNHLMEIDNNRGVALDYKI